MEHKESYDEGIPFDRMKVRLAKIVAIENELASKRGSGWNLC
jgi:predicted sulfurtransferase